MVFNGFYYDWKWWSGSASATREFSFNPAVNVLAFGALTGVVVSGGQGCAYVGIGEVQIIDPNTGRPINQSTEILGQMFPSPSFEGQRVNSVTFMYGSNFKPHQSKPEYQIEYANANMTILLWS